MRRAVARIRHLSSLFKAPLCGATKVRISEVKFKSDGEISGVEARSRDEEEADLRTDALINKLDWMLKVEAGGG